MADPKPETRAPSPDPRPDETIKETFEAIIIAFVLAFVFRAFVVEAFVIPTGSMAPTLLGEHIRLRCPDCGYEFDAEPPPARQGATAVCPMSGHPIRVTPGASPAAGDRILVHKYLYQFSGPRRWDVVVFKNPSDPDINYIKRLVGMPDESLYLLDGNIFVAPHDEGGRPIDERWHVARKTDRPKVQRAVWQPIYYSDYVPVEPGRSQAFHSDYDWQCPWEPTKGDWDMTVNHGRSYRFLGDSEGGGKLRFTFANWRGHFDDAMAVIYGYNQLNEGAPGGPDMAEPIEDVRLAVVVEPGSDAPLRLELRTTGRLDAGPVPIAAVIEPDGQVRLVVGDPQSDDAQSYDGERITPLGDREAARVEFWFVDLEASVWVDGRRVLDEPFDIDFQTLRNRPSPGPLLDPAARPRIALGVSGGPATLHHVELDRDIFYSGFTGRNMNRYYARGALIPAADIDQRLDIGPDEFFCLGDNSPLSHDGRFWGRVRDDQVNPWIQHRMFGDNPLKQGLVPRDLMMGRAFFIYWPAPYPLRRGDFGVLPNFGDMRFIH